MNRRYSKKNIKYNIYCGKFDNFSRKFGNYKKNTNSSEIAIGQLKRTVKGLQADRDLQMSLAGLMLFILFAIFVNFNGNISETAQNIFVWLGGLFLMAKISDIPFKHVKDKLKPYTDTKYNEHKIYEEIYNNELKSKLNKKNQELFEKMLDNLQIVREAIYKNIRIKNIESPSGEENPEMAYKEVIKYIDYIFILLNSNNHKVSNNDIKEIVNRLDLLLDTYKDTKEELKNKIMIPLLGNMVDDSNENLPISPIYLVGPPGTGKTRFVEELSKELNISIINITKDDFSSNRHMSFDEYLSKFDEKNINILGKIAYETYKKNEKNIIVFIDELDKMLQGSKRDRKEIERNLLMLIKPDLTSYVDRYLGIEIKLPNMLLITTGNKKLSDIDNALKPLESRFIEIQFNSINKATKWLIIYSYLETQLNKKGIQINDKIIEDVSEIYNNDNEPGIRQLIMNVDSYIQYYVRIPLFEGTSWNIKPPVFQDNDLDDTVFDDNDDNFNADDYVAEYLQTLSDD